MRARFWMVALVVVSAGTALHAQQRGGADVWQKYQDKLATVADYSVTMATQSGSHSFTSRMARLAPRTRMEMELPGMGAMAMIHDPEAVNDQGSKGVSYTLFLARKAYLKMAVPPSKSDATKAEGDVKVEELGKETIDGVVCDKRRVTITDAATTKAHAMLLWVSPTVRNMPVQIESTEQGTTTVVKFRNYNFDKPDASLFVVPADFTAGGMMPFSQPGAASAIPALPGVPVDVPVGGAVVPQVVVPDAPVPPVATTTPAQDAGDAAKDAVKENTQNAVQEGVNRGFRKVLGW